MKKSHRTYLSEEEAGYLGIDINPSGVYRLKQKDHIKILKSRTEGDNSTGLATIAEKKLKQYYNIDLYGNEDDSKGDITPNTNETSDNGYEKDEPFVLSPSGSRPLAARTEKRRTSCERKNSLPG